MAQTGAWNFCYGIAHPDVVAHCGCRSVQPRKRASGAPCTLHGRVTLIPSQTIRDLLVYLSLDGAVRRRPAQGVRGVDGGGRHRLRHAHPLVHARQVHHRGLQEQGGREGPRWNSSAEPFWQSSLHPSTFSLVQDRSGWGNNGAFLSFPLISTIAFQLSPSNMQMGPI